MKLELKGISKGYQGKSVIENIDIKVHKGELVSILGPSGVGKTTILKIIAGLIMPDKGRIYLDGKDITDIPSEKRDIAYVFQDPLLFPHMTVYENIAFGLKIKLKSNQKRPEIIHNKITELISNLQLDGLESRMPGELSGGQQQRVAIARALAIEPQVILMDEPFSSLDPQLRMEMGNLMKSIQKRYGLTIIFVTHNRNEGISLSNKAAVLLERRIQQADLPLEIYYRPGNKQIAEFFGPVNYIKGKIKDEIFHTVIGKFPIESCYIDGILEDSEPKEVELLLRPHSIKILPQGNGFIIKESNIIGKEIQYCLCKGDITIIAEDYLDQRYSVGQDVGIKIITDNLHFLNI